MKREPAFKPGELKFSWSRCVAPSAYDRIECFVGDCCIPRGIVWFRFSGKENLRIELLNSNVESKFRRRGMRTAMHRQLIEWFPKTKRFATGGAACNEAKRWLLKMGFKQEPIEGWILDLK